MIARSTRLIAGCVGVLLSCAACGFRGPLYLPARRAAVVTHPAPSSAAKSPLRDTARAAKKRSDEGTASPPAA